MGVYTAGLEAIGRGGVTTTGAYTVLLLTTGYVFSEHHNTIDDGTTNDPKSYETTVGGYARQTLGSVTRTEDDTGHAVYFDATDPTFTALVAGQTIGHAVIALYSTSSTQQGTASTSDTGQILLSYYETTSIPTNGSNVTLTLSTGGFLQFYTT